jgi:3-oxoacyl-[acyl-carrier protein] reductase
MADPRFPLEGRTVLVTGGSSGIGRAIAIAAATAGADVGVTYASNLSGARETTDRIGALGRRASLFHLDLAANRSIDGLVDKLRSVFPQVDGWVNNAGADILTGAGAQRAEIEKLDRVLAIDLRGTILASWAAADLMHGQPEGGVIVNMSWDHAVAGGMGGRNPEVFAAAKGGVWAFSKSLARTLAPEIRVNVLAPGWIQTAFAEAMDQHRKDEIAASTPLRRLGTAEDVAQAAVYLMSPAASYLTGQTIFVNGGDVMG